MKKSLILSMAVLMLGIVSPAGARIINTPEHLVFGKRWIEGSLRAQAVQRLHVEVTNSGTDDYQQMWWVADNREDQSPLLYGNSREITLAAGETKVIEIDLYFEQEGHYEVIVRDQARRYELFHYQVDIAPYQAPRLKGKIRLDMLDQTDEGNILYGDFNHFRITGTVTITNEEEYPFFGQGHLMLDGGFGLACVVTPWFGRDYYTTYEPIYTLPDEIKPGETITYEFLYEFVAVPAEDKEYELQIDAFPDETICRIPFKVRQCTNTYWTADGHVKPLSINEERVLQIPEEALAVDMRGIYERCDTFIVDVSQANPNCLYYLGFLDNVPPGFSDDQNVIRDYEARMLYIKADKDYYCPMPFKAKTAVFDYMPVSEERGPAEPWMSQIMSGTIVLPFDATRAWLTAVNDSPGIDAGFNGDNLQLLKFKYDYRDILIFEHVREDHLNAYEPYLLFTLPSQVEFYAENVTVPATRPAVAESKNFEFIGHTTKMAVPSGAYQWSCDHNKFFLSGLGERIDWAGPFTALMYPKNQTETYEKLIISSGEGVTDNPEGSTKIDAVSDSPVNHSTAVYSFSGQRVGTAEVHEGRLTVSGLRPGLYIIDGKKIVVR